MIFTSLDGDGTEVRVEITPGVVTRIDEHTKAAQIEIKSSIPALKKPVKGFVTIDDPIYDKAKALLESGEEATFRIEVQRKASQPRDIPINDLRAGDDPDKRVTRVLAAIDDVFSHEALTNPAEDPVTGRGRSAIHDAPRTAANSDVSQQVSPSAVTADAALAVLENSVKQNLPQHVIAALQSSALLAGASWEDIVAVGAEPAPANYNVRAAFSQEAPAFKLFNSDGRFNVGNYATAATVGVSIYVTKHFSARKEVNLTKEQTSYLTEFLLSVIDRVQALGYGDGARPDRMASSHTRARSIVFALIDTGEYNIPAPVGDNIYPDYKQLFEYAKVLGKRASFILQHSIDLAQSNPTPLSEVLARAKAGAVKVKSAEQSHSTPNPQTATPSESSDSAAVQYSQAEVEEGKNLVAQLQGAGKTAVPLPKPEVAPVTAQGEEGESADAEQSEPAQTDDEGFSEGIEQEPNADGVMFYPQHILPSGSITSENAPSEEVLDEFKQFVNEDARVSKNDLHKVTDLLRWTFGKSFGKASFVPEEELMEFLDFYTSVGAENFIKVLNSIPTEW